MKIRSLALAVVIAGTLASTALAQVIGPTDAGAGIKRGMEEQNNSGEVGDVTLFARGTKTRVLISLHGEGAGRSQPADVHRGQDCDAVSSQPAYPLNPVVNGTSSTVVNVPASRLLSGNYVVIVHAGTSKANMQHYLSCGRLYSGE